MDAGGASMLSPFLGMARLSWMHMKIILFKTKTTLRDERDWVY